MNCRTFNKRVYDYQDGTLPAGEKAQFELHRSGCKRCAARMEAEAHIAEVVRTGVEDACRGLEFDLSAGRPTESARSDRYQSWWFPSWRITATAAALLIVVLLLPAALQKLMPGESGGQLRTAQNVAENHDRWTQEIHVTYENGLQDETTLVSHDAGGESIIEIQVCYFP